MGITQINYLPNIDGKSIKIEFRNKVDIAIMRLREFESLTKGEGFYFADSYGKDSCVVDRLLDMAGVPHDAHYSKVGIDAPELVYFGRRYHSDTIVEKSEMSIWEGVTMKGMPRRQSRWCCEMLKEKKGGGRYVVTGIRWQESPRRKDRRMIEVCRTDATKVFVNPIIDWTHNDVWEYIHANHIPYCSLYDEKRPDGKPLFKRLGCILCPMESAKQTLLEQAKFPKLAELWKRACYRYWEAGSDGTKKWATKEAMWQWWLSRKGEPKVNDAQCVMFDN